MKRKIGQFSLIIVFVITIFAYLFTTDKGIIVNASTPSGVYFDLETSATEIMPGEEVEISFNIRNIDSIVNDEGGISVLMLSMEFDASKFELPVSRTFGNLADVDNGAKTLSAKWLYDLRSADFLIVRYELDNPNFLTFDIAYENYAIFPLAEEGFMFSLKFKAKDDAAGGTAQFKMVTLEHYNYVVTASNNNVYYDVSLAEVDVKVTGEPVNEYTISFDSDGGSPVSPITGVYGDPITKPADPTKDGYKFMGWYHNDVLYNFSTMPNQNISLVAKWEPIEYTIKYDANGGSGTVSSQNAIYDQEITLNQNSFTRAGYKFMGWSTTPSGNVYYFDQAKVNNLMNSEGEITLYAVWEKIPYTLFIDSSYLTVVRGSNTLINGSSVYIDDVLTITYSRLGYSSATITVNGTELSGSNFTVGSENVRVDISDEVLTNYSITYHLNGGVNDPGNPNSYNINSGEIVLNDPVKAGYEFVGWYTASTGGTKVSTINPNSTKNIVVYARWLSIYTITLDPNGGMIEGSSDPHQFSILENEQYGAKLLVPDRTGHTFLGWYTAPDGGSKVNYTAKPTGSVTLYARWQVLTSTITFVSNGGSSVSSITREYGANIDAPANPTRTGYTFMGWYLDNTTFQDMQSFPLAMPEANLTLYAKWEVNEFTITFNSNGGSAVADIIANYGTNISAPAEPTRSGYIFAGWYLDNNTFANPYSFTTMGANDLELYAKWLKVYTINLDPQGGNISSHTLEVVEGSKIGAIPNPTRTGYIFKGWWTNVDGQGVSVNQNTNYTYNYDLTLYAYWEAIQYTINFNSNGGTSVSSITGTYNQPITKPNNPNKIGYTFEGWYLDNNTFNNPYEIPDNMPDQNLTVYAKWEIRSDINISFDVNGGSPVTNLTNLTFKQSLTLPVTTRSGYKFAGWFTDEAFTNQFTSPTVPAESVVLYAKWLEEYTISFETNSSENISPIIRYQNDTYGSLPTPTKLGHKFLGWFKTSDFQTGSEVKSGDLVTSSETLYGKWEINTYTITFHSEGGSAVVDNPRTYNFGDIITAPNNPTRAGYVFAGWFTTRDGLVEFVFDTMPANNLNLYAKWVKEDSIEYTIRLHDFDKNGGVKTINRYGSDTYSFPLSDVVGYTLIGWYTDPSFDEATKVLSDDVVGGSETEIDLYAKWEIKQVKLTLINNGNVYHEIMQDYDTPVSSPADPTLIGHTFLGWYRSNDGGTTLIEEYVFDRMPNDDVTIYAKWEANTYTITFDSNGGNNIPAISRPYGTNNIVLPTPNRDGYKFLGWYDDADNLVSSPYTIEADITLTAEWEILGFNDTTIDKIIIKDLSGNVIKVIDNVSKNLTVYIPNEYEEVELEVVPLYGITTVDYLQFNTLLIGEAVVIDILVTAMSGKEDDYKLTLIRDTQPILTDINLNNGIDLEFDSSFDYNLQVPIDISNLIVSVDSIDSKNSIKINGVSLALSGLTASRNINLNAAGSNTVIKILVTSLSGEVENEYTVTIYRSALSNDARLTNLDVYGNKSNQNELYQKDTDILGFDMDVEDYYLNVSYKDTSIVINPTFAVGASAQVIGNENLQVGSNLVSIVVTASDGFTTKTYTIEVTREAPSSVAEINEVRLRNLDTGKIEHNTAVVDGEITIINVPYDYININIIPILSASSINASITDLGNLALSEGENNYEINVTAEDGVTTKTYKIRIVRKEGNTDNTLSYLSIGGLSLTPNLDLNNVFTYSLTDILPYTTYSLVVDLEKVSPEFGYVTIKYGTSALKTKTLIINPTVGKTTLEIKVYPEKGEAKTYLIEIEKENITGNYELSDLLVKDMDDNLLVLTPDFNMQVLSYDLGSLEYQISKLKIIASPVIGSSIVSVTNNGVNGTLINNEYIVDLLEGNNEIIIKVVSTANPSLFNEYKVKVNRGAGEDINTATINSSMGRLERSGNDYTLTLPKSSTGFILNAIKDSDKSIVKIDGEVVTSKYFEFRTQTEGTIEVEVISEVGNSNKYIVNVVRSQLSDSTELNFLQVTGNKSKESYNINSFPGSLTLPYMDTIVTFNPSFKEIGAKISPLQTSLAVGLNTIVLTVIAEDGFTYQNYIVKITREVASDIAILESIILSDPLDPTVQYAINEQFTFDNFNYTSSVGFGVKEIMVNPIALSGFGINYFVRDDKGNIIDGSYPLEEGTNNFIIEVISEQNTINYYYLEVNREAGDGDTSLEYLTITDQELNYNKDTLVYPNLGYFDYSYDYTHIYLSAKTTSNTSKIVLQINSEIYNFGNTVDYKIDLVTGINIIRVIVVAENEDEVSYRINLRKGTSTSELDIFDILVSGLDSNNQEVEQFDLANEFGNLINFELNNLNYYVTIPYKYKKILINPQIVSSLIEPMDLLIDVIPGETVRVNFKVSSPDGLNSTTYSIFVQGEDGDSDTTLEYLEVLDSNNNNYLFDFSNDKSVFDITIPKSIKLLNILASANSNKASIVIGDKTSKPFSDTWVNVEDEIDIYVWVTAENGDTKPYVVRVRKSVKSDNAYLENITIKNNRDEDLTKDLIPKFNPTSLVYQMVVEYDIDELFIDGVGVDGAKIISGNHITNLKVLPDTNIAEVITEAVDGTTLTYTFLIFRLLPMQDASLSEITVNDQVIEILEDIYEYSLEFPYTENEITFDFLPTSRIERIILNGEEFSIEDNLRALDLGMNEFEIEVIAEDGTTSLVYKLNIERLEPAKEALIENLDILNDDNYKFMEKLLDSSYIESNYNPLSHIQYIFVDKHQENLVLKPNVSNNAKIKDYEDSEIPVSLEIGYNILPLTVIAEDGVTENNYFFVIKRGDYSNNTKIKDISVPDGLELKQVSNNLYRVKGRFNTKLLDLNITLEDENANYEIIGNENIKGNDVVTILVTAEDGSTIGTYYITIEKDTSILLLLLYSFILAVVVPSIGTIVSNSMMKRKFIFM